jgi:hypothetical protein
MNMRRQLTDWLTGMDVNLLSGLLETDRRSKDTSSHIGADGWVGWWLGPRHHEPTGVVRAWAGEYLWVVCSCAIHGLVALQSLEKHTNDESLSCFASDV